MNQTEQTILDIRVTLGKIEELTDAYIAGFRLHSAAKATLENEAALAVMTGEIVGKNEEERKASKRQRLIDFFEAEEKSARNFADTEAQLRFQRDRLVGLRSIATLLASINNGETNDSPPF